MSLELNNIYNLDALEGLKKLDDCSIDCIITSPPYYQLRDYIGFDINKSYCELAQERANNQPRLLTIFTIWGGKNE